MTTWVNKGAPTKPWRGVCMSSDGVILYATEGSNIWKSTDEGSSWSITYTNSSGEGFQPNIQCNSTGTMVLASHARTRPDDYAILISRNSGSTWNYPLLYNATFGPQQVNLLDNNVAMSSDGVYAHALLAVNGAGIWACTASDNVNLFYQKYNTNGSGLAHLTCNSTGSIVAYAYRGYGNNLLISSNYGTSYTIITPSFYSDLRWIALDPIGDYIVLPGESKKLVVSSNRGATWTTQTFPSVDPSLSNATISNNGRIMHIAIQAGSTSNISTIFTTTNYGATWNQYSVSPGNIEWAGKALNSFSNGYEAVMAFYNGTIYKYYFPITITYNGNGYLGGTVPTDTTVYNYYLSYVTAKGVTGQLTRPQYNFIGWNTASNGTGTNYQMGETFQLLGEYTLYANWDVARCFKEDSTILCFIDGEETYIPVQNIKTGTLVKTHLSGYIPVNMIGTSKLYNPNNGLRSKHRLFRYSKNKYPELTEDLIITGCHSILVTELTETQKKLSIELTGDIYVTENRYRLIAMLDENSEPYDEEGVFNIWHFALDNDDMYSNYGVYANGGLLVETCSKRMMTEYSGLELKE
jgi:photosystem II stability/assembly factor-like uncharacterized protein